MILYYLPANTSHILQPANISLFGAIPDAETVEYMVHIIYYNLILIFTIMYSFSKCVLAHFPCIPCIYDNGWLITVTRWIV